MFDPDERTLDSDIAHSKKNSRETGPAVIGIELQSRDDFKSLIAKLEEHGWNRAATAKAIDTPRSNLYKKLEQYQITQESDG